MVEVSEWLTLADGEEIRWQGSPRIQTLIVPTLIAVAVAVGVALTDVPIVFAPLAFALPVIAYLWVRTTQYVVTNTGVYKRSGILSVRVANIDFVKIENSSFSQSVLGTLFDHGTVAIDTAGGEGTEMAFRNIDDPRSVQERIATLVNRAQRETDEIPGTVDQWQAVRDELERIHGLLEPAVDRRDS